MGVNGGLGCCVDMIDQMNSQLTDFTTQFGFDSDADSASLSCRFCHGQICGDIKVFQA